jgi:hypothetical protein
MDTTTMLNHNSLDDTTPMDTLYTSHHYEDGSIHSRSTSGSKRTAEEFDYDNEPKDNAVAPRVSMDNQEEDEITLENLAAVSTERSMIYKENTTRLSSILESIKNSTKTVLAEMNVYLGEMEEVEKTYIKCRAKTQKEGRRLEGVAPDVRGATENFLNQAVNAGLFSGGDVAAMMGVGGEGGN